MSKKIEKLETRIKELESKVTDQRFKIHGLGKALETTTQLLVNVQPLIERLVCSYAVLHKKGILTDELIKAVTQEEGDAFVKAAHPQFAAEVGGKSKPAGTVEGDRGSCGSGVSGTEGVREPALDTQADEQSEPRPVDAGLQGIRAVSDGNNNTVGVGPESSTDVPA